MDPGIWAKLPTELVRKIFDHARDHLSIDVRLAFNLIPKRIPESLGAKLWYLLSNDGLFYNIETKTLHNFRLNGSHIIRRPVDISFLDYDLAIFNLYQKEHDLEITHDSGEYQFFPGRIDSFATEKRVILKGGGGVPTVSF
jgi:hypothetical protein